MPHRSPARFLAPLALVAAVVTVYLVARPELSSSPGRTAATTSSTATKAAGPAGRKKAAKKRTARRTTTGASGATGATGASYTVKPGDVLGSISESTGVSVADLMALNTIDAQNLRVGQKLKLKP